MEILCIGNALVDIFARGYEHVELRYGIGEAVQHIEIERLREILAVLPEFTAVSGGGSANVAKIAGLLGADVSFTGALGSDQMGRLFEENLGSAGVKLRLLKKNLPTGLCLMLRTEDGDTRIAASPSAARELSEDDINDEEIRQAKIVVIDGFILNRPALVRRILGAADKYGTAAAIDLGSAAIARERAEEILDYARGRPIILFMNEAEARTFYDELEARGLVKGQTAEDSEERPGGLVFGERRKESPAARRVYSFFKSLTADDLWPLIVVKLGKRGAISFAGGSVYRTETVPVIPLETTGAGDAFCAAFLTAWARNKSLYDCASLGNKAARTILDTAGTLVDAKILKNLKSLFR